MKRRSKAVWAAIIGQLGEFRGTQAEFCVEHGIGLASLRYQLARRRSRANANAGGDATITFVPVKPSVFINREIVAEGTENIVEMTIGQICLVVKRDSDPDALRLALRLAVETCGPT